MKAQGILASRRKMVRRDKYDEGLTSHLVRRLLLNKFVVIIGDSIQRGIYKDLVSLLQRDILLAEKDLRAKGELSFLSDTLIEGGVKGQLNNGINYTEVRQYVTNTHLVRFYFVTRCYNQYVESILTDLLEGPAPDLVIMNSCLWDMTRYGTSAITSYKENMAMLFCRFKKVLPSYCLMIWNTTLPISKTARGGFLVQEIEYKNHMLRMDVLESNFFARQVVVNHGYDVLDLHFWFRRRLDWRAQDGIHWNAEAHRHISELILTHVAYAWNFTFPSIPLHVFGPHHPSGLINMPQNLLPQKVVQAAQRLNLDEGRQQRMMRPNGMQHNRPTPYPPMPVLQNYSDHHHNYKQGGDYGGGGDGGGGPSHHPHAGGGFQQRHFGGFSGGQLCVPSDFNSAWTDYSDDNFHGVQRQSYRGNRPYY
ncbi:PC-esterase domain-containing protein 1A-like [Littorina saxatilis]|uniref:PC-esterase domain-containing protein 1A-like n=1 Tax=Littorina saxatilis TaxID=31220 RepID=UPI0038B64B1D